MVSASCDGWVKIWDTHMFVCEQVMAYVASVVAENGGIAADDGVGGANDSLRRRSTC